MDNRLLASIILILLPICLRAQNLNIEQVYTKDGSCYEGYITEQKPGVQVSIYAVKATLNVPIEEIKERRQEFLPLYALPESARGFLRSQGDTTDIKWTTLNTGKDILDGIYDTIGSKITVFSPRTYAIPWSHIIKTTKTPLQGVPWGIMDIVSTGFTEHEGLVSEQIPGERMTIVLQDGERHVLTFEEIDKVGIVKINPKDNLWKQVQFIDRVILDDGEQIEGVITSRTLGRKITLQQKKDDREVSIPISEIKAYQKYPNPLYETYKEPPVDTVKVVRLNGKEVPVTYLHPKDKQYILSGSQADESDLNITPSIIEKAQSSTLVLHNYPLGSEIEVFPLEVKKGRFYIKGDLETDITLGLKDNGEGDQETLLLLKKTGYYFICIMHGESGKDNYSRKGLFVLVKE